MNRLERRPVCGLRQISDTYLVYDEMFGQGLQRLNTRTERQSATSFVWKRFEPFNPEPAASGLGTLRLPGSAGSIKQQAERREVLFSLKVLQEPASRTETGV